jgi:hypothetical protein
VVHLVDTAPVHVVLYSLPLFLSTANRGTGPCVVPCSCICTVCGTYMSDSVGIVGLFRLRNGQSVPHVYGTDQLIARRVLPIGTLSEACAS